MRLPILGLVLATIVVTVAAGNNERTCDECHNRIQGSLLKCFWSASCSTYSEHELSWKHDDFCADTCHYRCDWDNHAEMMEAFEDLPKDLPQ
ncbi:hypothetical protein SLS61_001982 [Didymella pomorum]